MKSPFSLTVRDGIGNLVFDTPDSDVNILTSEIIKTLDAVFEEISARADLKALLVTSAKPKIFIAGANIKEIEGIREEKDAFEKAESGKIILKKLMNLKIPTICVINGACLGGGYELALGCQYRITSFSPNVKIGLPEVNLGILPGFGGSIRLPRLLGLLKSMPLILTGKMVSGEDAFKIGMVDRVVSEKTLLEDAFLFAQEILAGKFKRRAQKTDFMTCFLENTALGRMMVFSKAKKDVLSKTKGQYPAPLEILKLLSATYGKKSDLVYTAESKHFARLAVTDVSKNLIHVFYLSEKFKKAHFTSAELKSDGIEKCGIVGAGVMGGAIAQLASFRDIPVRVKDVNEKALGGALKEADSLYKSLLKKKRIKKHQMENGMGRISVGLTDDGLQNCQMVIEAVVEDLSIKQKVFKSLSEVVSPSAILASNTSSLPVTKMAEACKNPERVVGLHFFNPVSRMPLVEVIRAAKSSDEAIERTVLFARRLGKTVILTADTPGFLVNRLLLPYLNEAAYLLREGFSPVRIDAICETFGMPMGPVELADQVGIDVGYKVAHILQDAFGDRMKVAPILEEAKAKGLLGKKSSKGFYEYKGGGKIKTPNKELNLVTGHGKISDQDALKRMIYIMINEAARCLDEKVVDSAATVDIGMIMGTGFAPFRGGLLRFADSVGLPNILKDIERFQKEVDSKRFEPAAYLKTLVASGKSFYV